MKWIFMRRIGLALILLSLTAIIMGYGVENNRLNENEIREETNFSVDASLYIRKIWIVEKKSGKIYTKMPLSLVITRLEENMIEGYLCFGKLVSKYYFDINNADSNQLLRFHGIIDNNIAECEYGQDNVAKNNFEITFCKDDEIMVSIDGSETTGYLMRPYHISDIERLSENKTVLEVEINTWGIGQLLYVKVDESDCLFLTDDQGDVLFQFLAPYNVGEKLQNVQIEDRDGDGLEDIKVVVGYFSDWDNKMHCREWWFYQEKAGGFSLGWTGHYRRKNNAESGRREMERYSENPLSMTPDELSNYLIKYARYDEYAVSIYDSITNKLKICFPNLEGWTWDIIEKSEEGYIVDVSGRTEAGYISQEAEYRTQILLKPDFSIELLSDTIEVDPERDLCIYATGQEFVNCGTKMETYCTEYYNGNKNLFFNAAVPLFSLKEGMEWNEVNCVVWQGLKKWIDEQEKWENGEMLLDYEIMRQDNDLFSILFSGEWKPYVGKAREIAMGMTLSMSSRELLEETVFIKGGKKDSYFEYYIEGNEIFVIKNTANGYTAKKEKQIGFEPYSVERRTANVYGLDGHWKGECFYDLFRTGWSAIDEKLREDMGRFFNGLAQEFREEVVRLEGIDELPDETGCYCTVESKLYRNDGNEFGIIYHYYVWMESIHEEGDAIICFDINSKEILEYQDWQSEIITSY